jgi:hypothetical protein
MACIDKKKCCECIKDAECIVDHKEVKQIYHINMFGNYSHRKDIVKSCNSIFYCLEHFRKYYGDKII